LDPGERAVRGPLKRGARKQGQRPVALAEHEIPVPVAIEIRVRGRRILVDGDARQGIDRRLNKRS